ncbi:MAG: hypothetical protein HUU56_08435 [Bdellovibrionaceae bacterium]|nr:hypothetical protein [Pseudobdellovibrionaceae bacterium]
MINNLFAYLARFLFMLSFSLLLSSCQTSKVSQNDSLQFISAQELFLQKVYTPGYLSVVQGPTTDKSTSIALFVPRLKNYEFKVTNQKNEQISFQKEKTLEKESLFWKVEKIYLSDLSPSDNYKLEVIDNFRGYRITVDTREFKTLNITSSKAKFALLSCMSDDYRYRPYIGKMWEQLASKNVDFIILNGDVVYVDGFDFVARQSATGKDIWQRYIDSMERIPLYHWYHLKPIFATWDDHDFGTNDGDETFSAKKDSQALFRALFWGKEVPNTYEMAPMGVSSHAKIFGQNFYFMDDRFERRPNKGFDQDPYGHWGKTQHQWLLQKAQKNPEPSWIINGDQFFSFKKLDYKEAMQMNHPAEFETLLNELKTFSQPFVLLSGDVHFTEITQIPFQSLNYNTYEITSSSMHSHHRQGWDNPHRLEGTFVNEFNFVLLEVTKSEAPQQLEVNASSWGLKNEAYFQKQLKIKK